MGLEILIMHVPLNKYMHKVQKYQFIHVLCIWGFNTVNFYLKYVFNKNTITSSNPNWKVFFNTFQFWFVQRVQHTTKFEVSTQTVKLKAISVSTTWLSAYLWFTLFILNTWMSLLKSLTCSSTHTCPAPARSGEFLGTVSLFCCPKGTCVAFSCTLNF